MKIYDEAIAHVAHHRIEIDLDDGVKGKLCEIRRCGSSTGRLESIKSRFDGKIIKGMMDIQLVTELKDSLHNYDGGLAIERRDSRRIKY